MEIPAQPALANTGLDRTGLTGNVLSNGVHGLVDNLCYTILSTPLVSSKDSSQKQKIAGTCGEGTLDTS